MGRIFSKNLHFDEKLKKKIEFICDFVILHQQSLMVELEK